MLGYLRFVAGNARLLGFGFLLCLASSIGQTFFVSLFSGELRADLGLTNADLGLAYSLGTLTSAGLLISAGRMIDTVDLRLFTLATLLLAAASCLLMAALPTLAAWSMPALPLLTLGFFGLRFAGQGLMIHTAATTMLRYLGADRGKAVSIADLGLSSGEATFPLLGVAVIAAVGGTATWAVTAAMLLAVVAPFSLWLLHGQEARHRATLAGLTATEAVGAIRQWSRPEVLRDPRFWLILPAMLAPGLVVTGLYFHQVTIAAAKGWSMAWIARCFIAYAVAHVAAAIAIGPIIDRFGTVPLLPFVLAPLIISVTILAAAGGDLAALAYLGVTGLTFGITTSVFNALWPELYGVAHLGAIRALSTALGVLGSALSPVLVGALLDHGVGVTAVALGSLALLIGSTLLAILGRLRI